MVQHQNQRKFGLLQHHFSQQDTISVPAISSSSILPNKITPQTHTRQTDSHLFDLAQCPIRSQHVELTTYQPVLTRPYPKSDQASPTMSYLMLDQAVPMMEERELDQAVPMMEERELDQAVPIATHIKKSLLLRVVVIVIILALLVGLYLIWYPMASATSSPLITQQNFSGTAPKVSSSKIGVTTNPTANSGEDIQVYILGAVLHPGVYTLPANARVYQLLQAAGGPSSKADLVVLNLAAKLNDGQEIYVTSLGEDPPAINSSLAGTSSSSSAIGTSSNQSLVNINTASADELRQKLSISSKSAQAIVSYRQQHGPFTSVDQLLQVVSKSIYDKIKSKITI
jgi:competence protein ComEA